ncbi:unnamed protein product [Lepidochelys kempii]
MCRPSLISTPTVFSDHKMDNKSKVDLTDLGRRNFLMLWSCNGQKTTQLHQSHRFHQTVEDCWEALW